MSLTKSGVEYNLAISKFIYKWGNFRFHFSSQTHLNKFALNVRKRIEWLDDSLSRRFKFIIKSEDLSIFQLYHQIETRGFYIVMAGLDGEEVVYTSPEEVEIHARVVDDG